MLIWRVIGLFRSDFILEAFIGILCPLSGVFVPGPLIRPTYHLFEYTSVGGTPSVGWGGRGDTIRKGVIVIDGGAPKQAERFKEAMERRSVKLEEIRLVVLTHGHWDHIRSAKGIQEITGAKIAMHRQEKDWLEKSLKPLPPGVTTWGRLLFKIMTPLSSAWEAIFG